MSNILRNLNTFPERPMKPISDTLDYVLYVIEKT